MMAKGGCAHGPERPDALVGLGVVDGNQGLAATFPSRPQCGVQQQGRSVMLKTGRFVRLGSRFR
jgi:hypothetical protein